MNSKVFNACLLAGWFLMTLGALLYRPELGLFTGGLALVVLTLAIAVRFGVYDKDVQGKPAADKGSAG